MKLKHGAVEASGKVIVRGKARNSDVFLRHVGQSRAGSRSKGLPVNAKELKDVVIDALKTGRSAPYIWPMLYPAGPQQTIGIVCKETLSLKLTMLKLERIDTGDLHSLLYVGDDCLKRDRPAELRVLLNRAARWFDNALITCPAGAVLSSLRRDALDWTSELYASDLFSRFRRHLLELAAARYGPQHSLTKLLVQISSLQYDVKEMLEMYRNVITVIITNLTATTKYPLSHWYMLLARCLQESGQYGEAGEVLHATMHSTECDDPDVKMLCTCGLAWHYISNEPGMEEEAERSLVAMREAGTFKASGQVDPSYAYVVYAALAALAKKGGEEEAAVAFCRLQIEAACNEWGVDDGAALQAASSLVEYLLNLGRVVEAVEMEGLLRLTDEFSELSLNQSFLLK